MIDFIENLDIDKSIKSSLKVLYYRYRDRLESLPFDTQLHELIHYYFGDHFVERDCKYCYIHNLIADYIVEKFIHDKLHIDRSKQIKWLKQKLNNLGLSGKKCDLLHWDCNSCPFKLYNSGDELPKHKTSIHIRCVRLRAILERLIYQTLPKLYVGIVHRHYTPQLKKHRVFIPTKKVKKEKLNIIIDTSSSIPYPIVETVYVTVKPFIQHPNVSLYGFSDICYRIRHKTNIRYSNATNFKPVLLKTQKDKYNFVITDLEFDDYEPPLPSNYKVIGVGNVDRRFVITTI